MKVSARFSRVFTLLLIPLLVGISACSDLLPERTPVSLSTETPTLSPSATIVWFPATATPTQFIAPTLEPTPNLLVDIGDEILSDDFSDKTAWQVSEKPNGTVQYSQNRLTIAIQRPQGYLYSYRVQPILKNGFVEITTSISLCSGNDTYGLLFRSSSNYDFYRLLINCNGFVRLERVRNEVVNVLMDWTISSQLSAGGPLTLELGVWMKDDSFRIFINDVFQFEVKDDVFPSGWLGVFARSGGTTAVTVNFSDLQVNQLTSNGIPILATP